MAAAVVAGVEHQLRTLAQTKRLRPSEFFLDYDRLRSGFVTESQFNRVLWENMGIKLTEEQRQAIASLYMLKNDGRLNYRQFCENINQPFDPNALHRNPEEQKKEAPEFLGTARTLRPLSPASEARIEELLRNLSRFYQYRGINLRTSCEDFDRHHIGVINESQFYRSFPRPPELTEAEVFLLVKKYRDPDRPGLVNYLNLHHDIVCVGGIVARETSTAPVTRTATVSDYLPQELCRRFKFKYNNSLVLKFYKAYHRIPSAAFQVMLEFLVLREDFAAKSALNMPILDPGADNALQQILDRIRVAVFKNRIRTIEYFKDFDGLRSGIVTENQFVCGLSLAIGKEAQLSRGDIQKIAEFYRVPDGRVRYKEFCDAMENAFNIPDLEKKPTMSVTRPPTGALGRNLPALSDTEEARALEVLQELSVHVRRRRLMMYQYFKDYDRSKAYSRVVTPTQFGRILHFLSLNVAPEDFKLLCRKFADEATGDVNYPAFVQTVDSEFVNYTQGNGDNNEESARSAVTTPPKPLDVSEVNMETLMARIRHHALIGRRRAIDFFQDFDGLRSGNITKSQFRRCLSDFGLSALGHHNLSDTQFEALAQHYASSRFPDKVEWMRFVQDVESVFTQTELEKMPTYKVPSQEIFRVPKPGTMDWNYAADDHREMWQQTMDRFRQKADQRRILAKPQFQDFDRHNNGHITRGQFRQSLAMLELHCTEDEMKSLEAKYCNDMGVNYKDFLEELQPTEKPKLMYTERLKELRITNQKTKLPERSPAGDLEDLLVKIKTMVVKERVRIYEWTKDYDKLNSGRIKKINFRRALDLCKFQLNESEFSILEDHYQSPGDPDFIDYLRFSDDVESSFTTKELEKAPMLEVPQFRPDEEWQTNKVDPSLEDMTRDCLNRIADKVKKSRMQLFPLFEDFDKVHNGMVTRSQFRRVLMELELGALVGSEQEWVNIWEQFKCVIGGREDVNYLAFCDTVYKLCGFEWRKP